jgi:hypothetical protein
LFNTEIAAIIALKFQGDLSMYEQYLGCGKRTIMFV